MEQLSDAQRRMLSQLFDELVRSPAPGVPGVRVRRTAPGNTKTEREQLVAFLGPRFIAHTGDPPNDSYHLTLEGLLESDAGPTARIWIQMALQRLDAGATQPPELVGVRLDHPGSGDGQPRSECRSQPRRSRADREGRLEIASSH
jgi:hypothetical protein